jgi:putative transposase
MLVSAPPNLAPSEIMRRIKGRTASYLCEEFPHLKQRYGGQHFWAREYFCATVRQMTEAMIKPYLEHHFEPNPNDDFRMEPDQTCRAVDAYPDFQSVTQTHRLQPVVV